MTKTFGLKSETPTTVERIPWEHFFLWASFSAPDNVQRVSIKKEKDESVWNVYYGLA